MIKFCLLSLYTHCFSSLKFFFVFFVSLSTLPKFYFLSFRKTLKIELGSGSKRGSNYWLTIDTNISSDLPWDLRFGLPLRNNSVSCFYASHLFEHLDFHSLKGLLTLIHSKLKPGGTVSLAVPNAQLYIKAYCNSYDYRISKGKCYGFTPALAITNSYIDQLNYIAYLGGLHKVLLDPVSLSNLLSDIGFSVRHRDFDPDLDYLERDYESFYLLATK